MAQAEPVRDVGLDTAKAAAILLVVCWHVQVEVPADPAVLHAAFSFFYFKICLAAVPLFFTVSLALFLGRLCDRDASYCGRRLARLVKLYVFWSLVQTAALVALTGALPRMHWRLLLKGGPGLPLVGGSVFYFLFDLLVLTALACGLASLPRRIREPATWAALALGLAYLLVSPWTGRLLPVYLASFLVYVPLALLLCERPGLFQRPWLFTGLFAATGLGSMALSKYAAIVPPEPYADPSALLGVLAIFSLSRAFPLDRSWVRWLSVHSLGIFALHKYAQYAGFRLLHVLGYGSPVTGPGLVPSVALLAWTLLLTLLAVALLRRTPLSRYLV